MKFIAKIIRYTAVFILFAGASANVEAGKLTGFLAVKKSDELMRGKSLDGRYDMTVITPSWERMLKLHIREKNREKTLIHILSPAKEKGITSLRIKNNMWNYIPKIERTIKIPPSMMFQKWMGSDFTNDDIVKQSSIVYDYTHKILKVERVGKYLAYKIRLTPKPKAAVTWGMLVRWVRKGDFIPLREEYYDEKGNLIKVLTLSKIKFMHDRTIPTYWVMKSVINKGNKTIFEIKDIRYNTNIDDSVFTIQNLKRRL